MENQPKKWYHNNVLVIVLCVFIFPVGLYGLWMGNFSKNTKIIVTGIIGVLFFIGIINNKGEEEQKEIVDAKNEAITVKENKRIDSINVVNARIQDSLNKIEDEKFSKTKAGKIYATHDSWSKDDCIKISKGEIWIGMHIDMLKYMWGNPNSANPSNYGNGTQWQWCWDDRTPSCYYGGEDGIITSYN
jgi:hypothetical protein